MTSSPAVVAPPELPGYRTGPVLGVGAGGPVWSAVRVADGRPVAVKVVRLPSGPGAVRASVELAALRAVHHPHVVRLLADVPLAGGTVALVLERVEGGSLGRVVRARAHLTAAETITVLTAIGTTLADLHRAGLAHGDVSPGNVLFHADGRPVLTDLGLARLAGSPGRQAAATTGFVDPAVLAGAEPGPSADVYGLAALGWYCLAGTPPSPAWLPTTLAELVPDAPAGLAALLGGILGSAPADRPQAAELACAAYDAGPAGPVRLATCDDPTEALTRRVRVSPPEPAVRHGGAPAPDRGWWRRVVHRLGRDHRSRRVSRAG